MATIMIDLFVYFPIAWVIIGLIVHFLLYNPLVALLIRAGILTIESENTVMPLIVLLDVVLSIGLAIYIVFFWL